MRLLPTSDAVWRVIDQYSAREATTTQLADGSGEAHVHLLRIGAGGIIDRHEAGFGQLWVALEGSGWVSGDDGVRHAIGQGEIAVIERGEHHAKGSDTGMTALMVQIRDLTIIEAGDRD